MTVAPQSTTASTASTDEQAKPAQPARVRLAMTLSVIALVLSGVSIAGWAQASMQRQQVEDRLACLELPGPNDCGQDGE